MKKIIPAVVILALAQVFTLASEVANKLLRYIKEDDTGAIIELVQASSAAELGEISRTGLTALHFAAIQNHVVAANELLGKGVPVDVRAPAKNNTTPLHWAASQESIDVIRLFVKNGADINAKADNGWAPLHFAVRAGKLVSVANLVKLGADINEKDGSGNAPIHLAAAANDLKMVIMLLKLNAKTDEQNAVGKLPIDMATDSAVVAELKIPAPVQPAVVEAAPVVTEVAPAVTEAAPVVTEAAPVVEELPATPNKQEKSIVIFTQEQLKNLQNDEEEKKLSRSQHIQAIIADPETERLSNGSYYKGSYRFGRFHGVGVLYSPDGTLYEGEFKSGSRSGLGTFTYSNGDVYTGEWKRNVPHGNGEFKCANGTFISGVWEKGQLIKGEGVYIDLQQNKYRAVWENNKVISKVKE
jgi:ankyrin repeat protein